MTIELLLTLALTTYGLTVMVNEQKGAFGVFEWFRAWVGITKDEKGRRIANNAIAEAVNCQYCLSVWLSLTLAGAAGVEYLLTGRVLLVQWLALPLALSGFVYVVKRLGG